MGHGNPFTLTHVAWLKADAGPERAMGRRSAKSVALPATSTFYVENVDKSSTKRPSWRNTQGPVMDMFLGDRCGNVVDPDGYTGWSAHSRDPT